MVQVPVRLVPLFPPVKTCTLPAVVPATRKSPGNTVPKALPPDVANKVVGCPAALTKIEKTAKEVAADASLDKKERATELLVRKNRNGGIGYVDLYFYARWMRFEDMLDPDR